MDPGRMRVSGLCPALAPFAMPAPRGHGMAGGVLFVVLMAALAAAITALVSIMDRARKRAEEAVHLQARIADALLAEPALTNVEITASARAPRWGDRLVTIDVRGEVPTPKLRDHALDVAIREATRSGLECRVVDRMAVVPAGLSRRAA